ncbi:hypothetical protein MCHI_000768, partial [Candidatus Magnetoovum chiemensis]
MPTIATREEFEDMTNRFESLLPPDKRPKRPTYEEYLEEVSMPIATREEFEDMTNRFESSLPPNKRP